MTLVSKRIYTEFEVEKKMNLILIKIMIYWD